MRQLISGACFAQVYFYFLNCAPDMPLKIKLHRDQTPCHYDQHSQIPRQARHDTAITDISTTPQTAPLDPCVTIVTLLPFHIAFLHTSMVADIQLRPYVGGSQLDAWSGR